MFLALGAGTRSPNPICTDLPFHTIYPLAEFGINNAEPQL